MILSENPSSYNPLYLLLSEVFVSKEPITITQNMLQQTTEILKLGGIQCENVMDTIRALVCLADMGILEIVKQPEPTGFSYKIGNKYNGK
jgi:hypothetical protein